MLVKLSKSDLHVQVKVCESRFGLLHRSKQTLWQTSSLSVDFGSSGKPLAA